MQTARAGTTATIRLVLVPWFRRSSASRRRRMAWRVRRPRPAFQITARMASAVRRAIAVMCHHLARRATRRRRHVRMPRNVRVTGRTRHVRHSCVRRYRSMTIRAAVVRSRQTAAVVTTRCFAMGRRLRRSRAARRRARATASVMRRVTATGRVNRIFQTVRLAMRIQTVCHRTASTACAAMRAGSSAVRAIPRVRT